MCLTIPCQFVNFWVIKINKKLKANDWFSQSHSCTETKTSAIKSGLWGRHFVWFPAKLLLHAKPFLSTRIPARLCRMRAAGERREAPSVLAQPVSASISSICQLLKISLSRKSWFFSGMQFRWATLKARFLFFIEINDNSVMYLQLQLLPDACRMPVAVSQTVGFVAVCRTNSLESKF